MGIATTDPPRFIAPAAPSLACPQYTISDGGVAARRALLFWVLAAVIMWEGHDPPGLW